jgi:hypothetical protein
MLLFDQEPLRHRPSSNQRGNNARSVWPAQDIPSIVWLTKRPSAEYAEKFPAVPTRISRVRRARVFNRSVRCHSRGRPCLANALRPHGTALASLIAAVPDNSEGIAGVGRNVKVMPLRILGEPGAGNEYYASLRTTVPQALRYAIRNGAKVIVCACSTLREHPERPDADTPEALMRETEKCGVLLVWSAGNRGHNIDEDPDYTSSAAFSNNLVVGGTTRDGTLSPHMNFGKRVGIAAPCVDMVGDERELPAVRIDHLPDHAEAHTRPASRRLNNGSNIFSASSNGAPRPPSEEIRSQVS